MFFLAIAGVAAVVAGGAAIWFGIPVKEFSFGNTMILAGAVAICNGLLLIGLGLVVRELKAIKQNLRERAFDTIPHETEGPLLPAGSIAGRSGRPDRDALGVHHASSERRAQAELRRQVVVSHDDSDLSGLDAGRPDPESGISAPELAAPVQPPAKGRRNLLFSSSRKARETGKFDLSDVAAKQPVGAPSAELVGADSGGKSAPHPSFNDTWLRAERSSRADIAPSRRDATLSPPMQADRISSPAQGAAAATVVKSGTVDGMAYSLYSDGSIEAQMPEGMMRFTSIEQLRAHLDHSR